MQVSVEYCNPYQQGNIKGLTLENSDGVRVDEVILTEDQLRQNVDEWGLPVDPRLHFRYTPDNRQDLIRKLLTRVPVRIIGAQSSPRLFLGTQVAAFPFSVGDSPGYRALTLRVFPLRGEIEKIEVDHWGSTTCTEDPDFIALNMSGEPIRFEVYKLWIAKRLLPELEPLAALSADHR